MIPRVTGVGDHAVEREFTARRKRASPPAEASLLKVRHPRVRNARRWRRGYDQTLQKWRKPAVRIIAAPRTARRRAAYS